MLEESDLAVRRVQARLLAPLGELERRRFLRGMRMLAYAP